MNRGKLNRIHCREESKVHILLEGTSAGFDALGRLPNQVIMHNSSTLLTVLQGRTSGEKSDKGSFSRRLVKKMTRLPARCSAQEK